MEGLCLSFTRLTPMCSPAHCPGAGPACPVKTRSHVSMQGDNIEIIPHGAGISWSPKGKRGQRKKEKFNPAKPKLFLFISWALNNCLASLDFDSKKVLNFRTVKCQSQWDHSSELSLLPSDLTLVIQHESRPAQGVPQKDALYRVLASPS